MFEPQKVNNYYSLTLAVKIVTTQHPYGHE